MPTFLATRPVTTVPDWTAEVLSPSNGRRDRVHKAEIYLTAGVPFYWIVDVGERTLEAYQEPVGLFQTCETLENRRDRNMHLGGKATGKLTF